MLPPAGYLVRPSTKVTKRTGIACGQDRHGLQAVDAAQERWRAGNAPTRMALVRAGALVHKGRPLERPVDITPAEPTESTGTDIA